MATYEQRQKQLERRQKMIEALVQQGSVVPRGQMVGDHFVAPGILDVLAPAAMVLAGQRAGKGLEKEELSLEKERQQALVQAMQGLSQARQGGTPDFDLYGQAMASEFPELQTIGMEGMKNVLAPAKPEKFKIEKMRDPASGKVVNVKVGDRGTILPVEDYEPATALKTAYGVAYDPYAVQPGQRVATPPSQSVTVNVPGQKLESGVEKEGAKLIIEDLKNIRGQRKEAVKMLGTLDRLESLGGPNLDRVLTGTLVKPAVFFARTIRPFVGEMPESIARSEAWDSTIAIDMSDKILNSSVGRSFTDTDREYVLTQYPSLLQTPEGRREVLSHLREASQRAIEQATGMEESLIQAYPQLGKGLRATRSVVPATSAQPAAPAQPARRSGRIKIISVGE